MALTKISGSVIKDSVSLSGNVSVGGTLTYQDVTNVDALGIGTFRAGVNVSGGNVTIANDIDVDGHTELDNVRISGITTVIGDIRKPYGTYHPMLTIRNAAAGSVAMRIDNWSNSTSTKRMSITHNFNRLSSAFAADDSSIGCASIAFEDGEIRFGTSAAGTNNSSTKFYINSTGHFIPNADSTYDIGTNSVRVRNVYADTLYGDGSNLTGITGTTINNNANNRVITGSGTANTLEGEANLTWDGNDLSLTGTAPAINFIDTDSDDYKIHNVQGLLKITDTTASADRFVINDNGTGYFVNNFQIGSTTTSPGATLHIKSSYPSLKIDDGNNNTNAYIGIIAGTGKESNINFGDPADDDYSQISYDHNGDHMKFKIGGSEKFRVNSNGLCIGGTGSANALEDYEEGTFTPILRGNNNNSNPQISGTGKYTKIGRAVYVTISFQNKNQTYLPSGEYIQIHGLPFTVQGQTQVAPYGMNYKIGFSTNYQYYWYIPTNGTKMWGYYNVNGSAYQAWGTDQWKTAGNIYHENNFTYMTS